jgi:hypothetical protein
MRESDVLWPCMKRVFHDECRPQLASTMPTKLMALTSPTTFLTVYSDLTFASWLESRRRRCGVDLDTERSLGETPGCDTTTYVFDGQSLSWCSMLFLSV